MSKLLIAALLTVFSTSVMAEWTRVGGDGDGTTTYADLSTIRKSDNKVKMWILMDFKVVQIDKNDGMSYLSSVRQSEYDCKEEIRRPLAFIWYSKNMGAGAVVYSSGAMHKEPVPVAPGSVGETFFKLACGK